MTTSQPEERPAKRLKTETETAPGNASQDEVAVAGGRNADNSLQVAGGFEAVLEKERQVGIASYVSTQQPTLTGTFKKRYTDFLVNEILPNGQVLHLKRTSVDKQPKTSEKSDKNGQAGSAPPIKEAEPQVKNEEASDEQSDKSQVSDEDRAKLVECLGESAVAELVDLYTSITSNPKKRARDHPVVKTPFTSDRTVRTEIHQAIRRVFHSRVDSSTNHEGVLVLSAANPNFRNNHQSRVGKLSWIERGGEHCHFTLYKEMKDTMESISFLSHLMKKNARDFQIAGTKDRRAATVQRVSVWRVEAERLAALNRNQTMRNSTLGDFEYHSTGLQLGDLAGNEFVITVRDIRLSDSDNDPATIKASLYTSLTNLHTYGFLNYYGLQRFGTFAARSDTLGLQILKGDFEGACNSILEYAPSALDENDENDKNTNNVGREDRARAQAIKLFRETNSIRDALNLMPKRLSAETAIIRALGRKDTDYLGALMGLQRNMRQMYVHAYQSLVWNAAVTERWRLWGGKVVEGDLVLVKEHRDKENGKDANGAAATVVDDGVDADGEVVVHPEGDDRARGTEDEYDRARALTGEEAASGLYSVFDIVLPLPGFDVVYPSNESGGEFYKRFMGRDGLDPYDMRRGQKDFSLSGSYRKMVARIGGVFDVEVRKYRRDEEQFVLTDREALMGGKRGGQGGGEGSEAGVQKDEAAVKELVDGGLEEKTAVVLTFQLGTSQYATMALRELSRGGLREYKPGFSGGR